MALKEGYDDGKSSKAEFWGGGGEGTWAAGKGTPPSGSRYTVVKVGDRERRGCMILPGTRPPIFLVVIYRSV